MQLHRLERVQLIQRPRSEVFGFFSDASNLEAITPAFLRFRITTPLPVEMCAGARIDYALGLFGVPVRWRTRITRWQPEECFVDEQEQGPYAYWRHLHEFESAGAATRVRDAVEYALPLGPLGGLVHALWVERTLAKIFDHRARAVAALLTNGTGPAQRALGSTPTSPQS